MGKSSTGSTITRKAGAEKIPVRSLRARGRRDGLRPRDTVTPLQVERPLGHEDKESMVADGTVLEKAWRSRPKLRQIETRH